MGWLLKVYIARRRRSETEHNLGRRSGISFWLVLVCALGLRSAHAQTLRGRTVDAASGQPIRGAVVQILNASGGVVNQRVTDERGQFVLPLPAGSRRVHVVRLGFTAVNQLVPASEALQAHFDIAMSTIPALLEAMDVTATGKCPRRPDRLVALGLLEQARAALLATVVARESPRRRG